jgi:hypothetical protein
MDLKLLMYVVERGRQLWRDEENLFHILLIFRRRRLREKNIKESSRKKEIIAGK